MMRKTRATGIFALGATVALLAAGCSGGGDGGSGDGDVTMTFWHNSTTGPGKAYWEATVAAFEEANPGVTIEVQSIQNEDMDGKLQTALNSGDAPDIFMARGGGKLADVVEAGQIMDLTDTIDEATKENVGAGFDAFTIDGKVYGMPTAILPGGLFYSQDLFEEAGITETPTTIDTLNNAVSAPKDADISPVALGGKDAWPAAHWYYFFALRACSQETLDAAAATRSFDDECWLTAGENLQAFAETEPFQKGFLTATAQQGAGSSAGLIATHKAAQPLMGAGGPGATAAPTPEDNT